MIVNIDIHTLGTFPTREAWENVRKSAPTEIMPYDELVRHSAPIQRGMYPLNALVGLQYHLSFDEQYPPLRPCYGVADSLEQIEDHFREAIADPEHCYVFEILHIVKTEQPARGGWRWGQVG